MRISEETKMTEFSCIVQRGDREYLPVFRCNGTWISDHAPDEYGQTIDIFPYFMLPEADDGPAVLLELGCLPFVSLDVGPQFRPPEVTPRTWEHIVVRASMPLATVDEHRNSKTRKRKVRGDAPDTEVDAVPQTC
jgi:hypothetical protein